MFRLFNNFELDDSCPFIQYQSVDGQLIYKFGEKEIIEHLKKKKMLIITRWFETTSYGISFKIKYIDDEKTNI